jgi:hypothetical protein
VFKFYADFFPFQLTAFLQTFAVVVPKLQRSYHPPTTLFENAWWYEHFLGMVHERYCVKPDVYTFDPDFFQDFRHLRNRFHRKVEHQNFFFANE